LKGESERLLSTIELRSR